MTPSSAPDRLLLLRFSSAGDVVLTAPAVEALKTAWPDTKLIYAVKRRFASLVEHNPHVDRVVALEPGESLYHFASRLRGLEHDALLDLHGKIRSWLLRWLVPAGRRVVWTKRRFGSGLPVRLGLTPYDAGMMLSDRFHLAVEKLVGVKLPHGRLRFWVGAREQAEADRVLARAGLRPGQPLVGMTPGANWATKRWPVDRFAELAARACAAGLQVAVTGNTGEAPLAQAIRTRAPGALDLTGVISLDALGGFVNRCTAFVANDSGPMHIARALGVPTLALFGSTDPRQFDFAGHAVLFAGVPCSPCHFYGRRRCPRGHFRCMREIEVPAAWAALERLIAGGRRALLQA